MIYTVVASEYILGGQAIHKPYLIQAMCYFVELRSTTELPDTLPRRTAREYTARPLDLSLLACQ